MQLETLIPKVHKLHLLTRAIKHPLREKIISYLLAHPGTGVTKLYCHFKLEQSVASQHLAILRKAGVVIGKRNGKEIHYSVNTEKLERLEKAAPELVK